MQTANFACGFGFDIVLIEVPFTLDFLLSYPVRFIPMNLSQANSTASQADQGGPFHFTPTSLSVHLLKAADGVYPLQFEMFFSTVQ